MERLSCNKNNRTPNGAQRSVLCCSAHSIAPMSGKQQRATRSRGSPAKEKPEADLGPSPDEKGDGLKEKKTVTAKMLRFPSNKKEASTFSRDAFVSNDADGRYIHKGNNDQATAGKISQRLHNGHLRKNPQFKRMFSDAFGDWVTGDPFVAKRSRANHVVHEYSRFLSTRITKIRKEWMKHQVPEDPATVWDHFVKVTRRTFENNFSTLVQDATKFSEAQDVLKKNFQVSATVTLYSNQMLISFLD